MNGQIEIKLNGRKVTVMGGPYRDKPENVRGVKLAPEISGEASVVLDVPDFGVPALAALNDPLFRTINILERDGKVYVGCMGGIGRTGMFIALLVKCIGTIEQTKMRNSWWRRFLGFFGFPSTSKQNALMVHTPVEYVRATYLAHAVETLEQAALVESYDPGPMLVARNLYLAVK